MSDAIALIDMDGTLVDYDGVMQRELSKLRSPGEPIFESTPDGKMPEWLEARRRLIALRPGFWRELPQHPPGFDILRELRELGYAIQVLTKGPSTKLAAWTEKAEWCKANLPSDIEITITENKSLSFGRVLVDDWPPYFMGWLKHRPRGIVIVPAQTWNVDVEKLAPGRIYRYEIGKHRVVRAILRAVKERQNNKAIDLAAVIGSVEVG